MKIHLTLIFGFCSFWCNTFAQSYDTILPRTDTLYFPFYNGVQMIEINHLRYYEMLDIRYSTMDQMPYYYDERPFGNEYFFRNESGKIVKSFNSRLNYTDLESKLRPVSYINRSSHLQNKLSSFELYGSFHSIYERKEVSYSIFNYKFQDFFDRDTSILVSGLIDSLGNVVLPIEFTYISSLKNGCFIAAKNFNYGIINLEQTVLVPFEHYEPHVIINDIIFFSDNTQIKYAFRVADKRVIPIINNKRQLTSEVPELFVTSYDQFEGVWNMLTNQQVIPNKYDHITAIDYHGQPNRIAIKVLSGEKYGLFDVNGKVILPCVYDEIGEWREVNGQRVLKVVKNGVAIEIK